MPWNATDRDIARWRLRTQGLVAPYADSADAVVSSLLAVQAENPAQSAWAVACRTRAPDATDLTDRLDDAHIVRTHVLRPTWHYVRAEDVGWLQELTAPRVRRTTGLQLRSNGFDEAAVEALAATVHDTLAASPDRTRGELAAALGAAGHDLSGQVLMALLADLELQRVVVSGRPRDGVHTYALFDQRVPHRRRLDRDEALAELARRYIRGHGPATPADLAYWATLTIGDARHGLQMAAHELASFEHQGRTYWHAAGEEPPATGPPGPSAHLLQILDEIYRGYQDSRMVLDSEGVVPRGRETSTGMALVDGQMVATMKRTLTPLRVRFDITPYDGRPLSVGDQAALEDATARYGSFLGLETELVVA